MNSFVVAGAPFVKELRVIIPDITKHPTMKPAVGRSSKKSMINGDLDDERVRYKLNNEFFQVKGLQSVREKQLSSVLTKLTAPDTEDDNVRYKLAKSKSIIKLVPTKPKSKTKLKVKFWSNKSNKVVKNSTSKASPATSPRKSLSVTVKPNASNVQSPKVYSPKLRQKVSFLPPPVFTDQHAPMVTVPDDLTVHFNQEEANYLLMTADSMPAQNVARSPAPKKSPTRKPSQSPQTSPKNIQKRRREDETKNADLEYFAKYVVQKLRKMETNQRIYSENLINTVLMLGQLQQLSGKSRVTET